MEEKSSVLEKWGIYIGTRASHTKTITETDIVVFAGISGDFNPLHLSKEYGQKTFFGSRIAHGVISLGLISAAIARLPGLVTYPLVLPVIVYLSQSAKFLKPVRIGDTITACVEVTQIREEKAIVTLKTSCYNQQQEVVTEGEATVRFYEAPSQD